MLVHKLLLRLVLLSRLEPSRMPKGVCTHPMPQGGPFNVFLSFLYHRNGILEAFEESWIEAFPGAAVLRIPASWRIGSACEKRRQRGCRMARLGGRSRAAWRARRSPPSAIGLPRQRSNPACNELSPEGWLWRERGAGETWGG